MNMWIQERAHWIARNILPHESAIRNWLNKSRVDDLAVDDIVQEMYARIASHASLETIRNPRVYAFQAAKSIIIDHIRRARIVSVSAWGNLEDLQVPTPLPTPEETLAFKDELAEVRDALASMSATTREILILRRVEGLSQRETARRLAISEKTVEKHMTRGVLLLMERLGRGGKSRGPSSKEINQPIAQRANRSSNSQD